MVISRDFLISFKSYHLLWESSMPSVITFFLLFLTFFIIYLHLFKKTGHLPTHYQWLGWVSEAVEQSALDFPKRNVFSF